MTRPYGLFLEYNRFRVGNSNTPTHIHPCHELYFLVSGQRRYFVDSTLYDIGPGELILIPKGQLHCTTTPTPGAGFERYAVYFYSKDYRSFIDTVGEDAFNTLLNSGCLHLPPYVSKQVHRDLEQIRQTLDTPGAYAGAATRLLLQNILLNCLLHAVPKGPSHGESCNKIQEVAHYIRANFSQPLRLAHVAQLANLEKTYFSKQFKLLTGFGFHEYLTQIRLQHAERLLLESDLPMNAIAERCGFSNSHHFSDVFRRRKGVAPSVYRNEYAKAD